MTTTTDPKTAAREFFAALDADQARSVPAVLAEGFRAHLPGMPPLDAAAFQQFGRAFYLAFPDLSHEIEDQVAEGGTVVNRLRVRGTHRGEFQGIPPTGKQVEISAVSTQRFEGGRLVEQHILIDGLGLMQQLGAIPAPAA